MASGRTLIAAIWKPSLTDQPDQCGEPDVVMKLMGSDGLKAVVADNIEGESGRQYEQPMDNDNVDSLASR